MNKARTLLEALLATKDSHHNITFIESNDTEIYQSYKNLYERACIVLHHLRNKGITPGSELLICTANNQQFLDAFWACQLGGIIAVPLAVSHTPQGREKLFDIYDTLQNGFVFSNRKTMEGYASFANHQGGHLPGRFAEMHKRYVAANELSGTKQATDTYQAQPTDTAMIQFSSGTTGTPKGIVLTHRNLLTNIYGIIEAAQLTPRDSMLSWMPLTHDMGLIGFHLVPLVLGANQYLMPTSAFARRPLLWLTKATEHKATVLASPNFGYQHYLKAFKSKPDQELDLVHVRLIFNGAEPISLQVCNAFCEAMLPFNLAPHTMFPVYGLAEASLAVSFPRTGEPLRTCVLQRHSLNLGNQTKPASADDPNARTIVRVGQPIPGCEVRIVKAGIDLPAGSVGEIQIRGDNVTHGYYGSPASQTENDWLATGDLGTIIDDGLYIVGRRKDSIVVNGICFHATDLEDVVIEAGFAEAGKLACSSVVDNFGERLVVFLQHRGDLDSFIPLATQVRRALNEKVSLDPFRIVPVHSLPKTSSGKVQRHSLVDAYAKGDFSAVIDNLDKISRSTESATNSTKHSEIERMLLDICQEIITTEVVGVSDDLFELGASSLALAEICEEINSSFPGQLELTDFLEYTSVRALAAYLEQLAE